MAKGARISVPYLLIQPRGRVINQSIDPDVRRGEKEARARASYAMTSVKSEVKAETPFGEPV